MTPISDDGRTGPVRPEHGAPDETLRRAFLADVRASRWRQRLLLVLAVGWIAYEWGLGNETVTPWLLSWVISEHHGWWVVGLAAVVGFWFTFAQQLIAGLSVLAGLSVFDRTARAAWARLERRVDTERLRWDGVGLVYRGVAVFTLGTSAVAVLQVVSSGRVGVGVHRRIVVESALLCATIVGALAAVVAAIGQFGRSVDVLATPTDWVLRVLGNPLFWIGVLGLYLVAQRLTRTDPASAGVPTAREAT